MKGGWLAIPALLAGFASPVWALEYRTVAADRTVMYDAPSLAAKKLYLATRNYPVEVVVSLPNFSKVRDAAGDMAWVENKNLSDKRMVMVTVPAADILKTPDEKGALAFRAEQSVVLELVEYTGSGWLKVRHADGALGYVRLSQVWGG